MGAATSGKRESPALIWLKFVHRRLDKLDHSHGALHANLLRRRPNYMKSLYLRQAAARDLRQRRMSERAGQRFTAVSQILIGSQYAHAREVDFRWSVDGILTERRSYR